MSDHRKGIFGSIFGGGDPNAKERARLNDEFLETVQVISDIMDGLAAGDTSVSATRRVVEAAFDRLAEIQSRIDALGDGKMSDRRPMVAKGAHGIYR